MVQPSMASTVNVTMPSLPKGGGSIQGMGESLGNIGAGGGLEFSLPLPVSAGRGYAPSLSLGYSSGAGNGVFGLGWSVGQVSVSRRTSRGVPSYDESDSFVGPDGEVLVPECDDTGAVLSTTVSSYGGKALAESYRVTRYLPRKEGAFNRIERWQSLKGSAEFWLIHGSDGQLHCLGKTQAGRIADAAAPQTRIAVWLLEESLSPTGEHIYYQYGDAVDVPNSDGRDRVANRYLRAVSYANEQASAELYLWNGDTAASAQNWHCTLVFDYGERGVDPLKIPAFKVTVQQVSPIRADAFSHYGFGFEVRTHFLCRQVLLYHHFAELGNEPKLISRLLLGYDENPVASQLISAEHLAYETDGTIQALPPLEMDYSQFTPPTISPVWKDFANPPGVDLPPYQLVDLYGEGLPGILYQVGRDWRYHEPVRDLSAGSDGVAYQDWETLPFSPAIVGENSALLDLDGDGRLEWMVAQPGGPVGYYRMNADRTWSNFIAFGLLPIEFLHNQASHVDLHGSGLPDLAMIGPKTVRLYINEHDGYGRARDVAQPDAVQLPIRGRDATELVAFSDILGSGQQHLISVRHDRLECWPNLGDGRFATPMTFNFELPVEEAHFNPRRVYLADVDGSGAADLLYADKDGILLLRNHSGNGFDAPVKLAWPSGFHYTDLDQISFADVGGEGTVSLILSRFYDDGFLAPHFWRYDFALTKPYLLTTIDNNLGACKTITYRSSAQEWLDEKQALLEDGKKPVCGLPFPVHLVTQTRSDDELTGNSLVSSYRFRNGFYDGREREFRGFGYVEAMNSAFDEPASPGDRESTPPQQVRSWYHTGRESDETALYGNPFTDPAAFTVGSTRLTKLDASNKDQVLDATVEQKWWLYRALNGQLLREEVYGLDDDPASAVPYSVRVARYQARLIQDAAKDASVATIVPWPVVLAFTIEQTGYDYQRVVQDPLISQSLQLACDQYGALTWGVTVSYPRRDQAKNPYSATALPAAAWPETKDTQQSVLRLQEALANPLHQPLPQAWLLNIENENRQNALEYPGNTAPGGLHVEDLIATTNPACLLGPTKPRQFLGQTSVHYKTDSNLPQTLRLVDCVETAILDQTALAAYTGLPSGLREQLLSQGGYETGHYVLEFPGVTTPGELWTARQSFSEYLAQDGFFKPKRQWSSALSPEGTSITYDAYHICALSAVQAYQNSVSVQNDYRFLKPWQITDINGNKSQVQYDALGRVVATSVFGEELKDPQKSLTETISVGFAPLDKNPVASGLSVSDAITAALSGSKQQQASILVFDLFSWMGSLSLTDIETAFDKRAAKAIRDRLVELKFISWSGALRSRARHWMRNREPIEGLPDAVCGLMQAVERLPVHSVTLVADAYPEEQQQVQISVAYSDGFGRALQSVMRVPSGLACDRLSSGELKLTAQGVLAEVAADPRWAVSGRVEYNNTGGVIRVYQPYFVNDWHYVADRSMRASGYADTHSYDALGREIRIVTAKAYQKRTTYTSWFVLVEDENDTWSETAVAS